ncbi:MAG: hypothetical protein RBG13Loki_3131 [Promethearchaeota archaeon CR_4]|nr:MAG: hypothetical protein RBG13Loki_3131 [Candidatus Lokiarchaeota archaeon CR_4]
MKNIETGEDQSDKEQESPIDPDAEEWIMLMYQNSQPTLFQRRDDTVVVLLYTTNLGVIHKTISTNLGFTWSEDEPTSLPNPDASIDCLKLENGDIILAFNNSTNGRSPLTLVISYYEGDP